MRLCLIARALAVISIALMVGYAYEVGVRGPYWPVRPVEWRTVGELGFLVCALTALVSAVIAAHCPGLTGIESCENTFTPQPRLLIWSSDEDLIVRRHHHDGGTTSEFFIMSIRDRRSPSTLPRNQRGGRTGRTRAAGDREVGGW